MASAFGRWNEFRPMMRAEPTAIPNGPGFFKYVLVFVFALLPRKSRSDDRRRYSGPHAVTRSANVFMRNLCGLIDFLCRRLFEMRARELDLDHMGTELSRNLRRVRDDINRRLTFLAQARSTGIGPDYNGKTARPWLLRQWPAVARTWR